MMCARQTWKELKSSSVTHLPCLHTSMNKGSHKGRKFVCFTNVSNFLVLKRWKKYIVRKVYI